MFAIKNIPILAIDVLKFIANNVFIAPCTTSSLLGVNSSVSCVIIINVIPANILKYTAFLASFAEYFSDIISVAKNVDANITFLNLL